MNLNVVNKEIGVGTIRIVAISNSSLLQVGDSRIVICSSITDTPPEAVSPIFPITGER